VYIVAWNHRYSMDDNNAQNLCHHTNAVGIPKTFTNGVFGLLFTIGSSLQGASCPAQSLDSIIHDKPLTREAV
jgi:hypothetical protein